MHRSMLGAVPSWGKALPVPNPNARDTVRFLKLRSYSNTLRTDVRVGQTTELGIDQVIENLRKNMCYSDANRNVEVGLLGARP